MGDDSGMWISRKKWNALEKRVADLEMEVQGQRVKDEVIFEFCRSVASKEKISLLSYQQLYSPSADSSQKVRMLFEKIRKSPSATQRLRKRGESGG